MKDNRLGAVALIIGAITNVIVLTFHPSGGGGHELHVTQAQFDMFIAVVVGVHVLAISGLPFSFLGATALSRKIDSPNRVALLALVIYAFSLVAIIIAASMSGLVTPALFRRLAAHGPDAGQWRLLVDYIHAINQSVAQIAGVESEMELPFAGGAPAVRTDAVPDRHAPGASAGRAEHRVWSLLREGA